MCDLSLEDFICKPPTLFLTILGSEMEGEMGYFKMFVVKYNQKGSFTLYKVNYKPGLTHSFY